HRRRTPTPRRLQPQVGAQLLKGRLDVPTFGVALEDFLRTHRHVGAVEVFVPVCPGQVVDVDPAHRHQTHPRLVPVPHPPDHPPPPPPAPPPHRPPPPAAPPPPYQDTFNRVRSEQATTAWGEGALAPLTRGRPLPA